MSRTAITVTAALPAGLVLGFAAQRAAATETVMTVAVIATVGSVCWYGAKELLDRRLAVPVTHRPEPGPGRRRAQTDTLAVRPPFVSDVIDQPHYDVATSGEHRALAEALEQTRQIPRPDPYLYPFDERADEPEMTPDQALAFVEHDLSARGAWHTSSDNEQSYLIDEFGTDVAGQRWWMPAGA